MPSAVDVVRPRLARADARPRRIAQVGGLVLRGRAHGGGGKPAQSLVTLTRVVTPLDRRVVCVVAVLSGLRKPHGAPLSLGWMMRRLLASRVDVGRSSGPPAPGSPARQVPA